MDPENWLADSSHTTNFVMDHSRPLKNQMKLKETLTGPAQDEQLCLKDSKYILFEILAHRTWKGSTSSYRPSKPDLTIWLARPAGASKAAPCPIC